MIKVFIFRGERKKFRICEEGGGFRFRLKNEARANEEEKVRLSLVGEERRPPGEIGTLSFVFG